MPDRLERGRIEPPDAGAVADVMIGLRERAIAGNDHRPQADLHPDRAAAVRIPAVVPIAGLVDLPAGRFAAGVVDLGVALGVELVVGDHGAVLRVEAQERVPVEDAAADRHGIDDLGRLQRNRQLLRPAAAGFPMHEVAAAGVAEVVVGRAIRAFPPDPADVENAFAVLHRPDEIGVPLAVAGEERTVDEPPPGLRLGDRRR